MTNIIILHYVTLHLLPILGRFPTSLLQTISHQSKRSLLTLLSTLTLYYLLFTTYSLLLTPYVLKRSLLTLLSTQTPSASASANALSNASACGGGMALPALVGPQSIGGVIENRMMRILTRILKARCPRPLDAASRPSKVCVATYLVSFVIRVGLF